MTFLSKVPSTKLSPLGCTAIDEMNFDPDLYLATMDCFCRLYWKTVWLVQAKKLGLVGWNAIAPIIPFVCENGLYEDALLME
jgi:hypothetical protein